MNENFINLIAQNIDDQHICCAISDKKHQQGVSLKKEWLKNRIKEGHTFRKLDAKGKVFIEYAPLETAWTPIIGDNFLYIYCLWVSGSFSGMGHARALIEYCIEDAKNKGKSGICVLTTKKKKPFLSDKKFMSKYDFIVVDNVGEYELLSLSFDGTHPKLKDSAKKMCIESKDLTIYYTVQCPYSLNCLEQVVDYCKINTIPLQLMPVDTLEKAKNVPCIFNNWAVFYDGKFETVHLLNQSYLKKLINQ